MTTGTPVIEGAGVHLTRAIGHNDEGQFDPFLLLDDFRSDDPAQYVSGFPWHPHRGMETITYVLQGEVEHSDSLGHKGVIGAGDVQWMTAGSGIIHQEMPQGDSEGRMYGFQLWANLPKSHKMIEPRYQEVKAAQIPVVEIGDAQVRVICGTVDGVQGPVRDIITDPEYLDVTVAPDSQFVRPINSDHTVFAYVIDGQAKFDEMGDRGFVGNKQLIHFGDGDEIIVRTEAKPVRFLLVSGKPIGEPIAWRGPIVMNTQEELRTALEEINRGTFIKHA